MHWPRLVAAALLAPLVAPALVYFFVLLNRGKLMPGDGFAIAMIGICSYLGFFLLGLPSIYLLQHFGRLSIVSVTLSGLLLGATVGQILPSVFSYSPDYWFSLDPVVLLVYGAFGAIAGAAFGLLAGIKRF